MKTSTFYKLISTLLILAAVGYGIGWIFGAIGEKTEVVRAQKSKEIQNESLEYGNQLRTNMEELVRLESAIQNVFIKESELVTFIQTLETMGNRHELEVSIEKVDQSDPQPLSDGRGKTVPITFTIQAVGSYADTSAFVSEMLGSEKTLTLKQVSVFADEDGYRTRMIVSGTLLSYE